MKMVKSDSLSWGWCGLCCYRFKINVITVYKLARGFRSWNIAIESMKRKIALENACSHCRKFLGKNRTRQPWNISLFTIYGTNAFSSLNKAEEPLINLTASLFLFFLWSKQYIVIHMDFKSRLAVILWTRGPGCVVQLCCCRSLPCSL